jgi:hypothetical protein
MKNCCNPEHKEPVPATAVLADDYQKPSFLCDACAWVIVNLDTSLEPQDLGEWEEGQLTEEEKRQRDRDDYHDREYHRRKDEGLR